MSNYQTKYSSANRVKHVNRYKPYQSLIVFPPNLGIEDVMRKLQSISTIKSTATESRISLNESNFNLKNKFCDAEEFKNSWNNARMPHKLIYIFSQNWFTFSATFSIFLSHIYMQLSSKCTCIKDDDGPDFTKRKVMKIKSLYQVFYYNLHDRKDKNTTPFICCPQCIRKVWKQKSLISSFCQVMTRFKEPEMILHALHIFKVKIFSNLKWLQQRQIYHRWVG